MQNLYFKLLFQSQVSSNRKYGAQIVYEEEHGICQMCNFDAQDFLQKLK